MVKIRPLVSCISNIYRYIMFSKMLSIFPPFNKQDLAIQLDSSDYKEMEEAINSIGLSPKVDEAIGTNPVTPLDDNLKPEISKEIKQSVTSLYAGLGDARKTLLAYSCAGSKKLMDVMYKVKVPEVMGALTILALASLPLSLNTNALMHIGLAAGGVLASAALTNVFFNSLNDGKVAKMGLYLTHEIAKTCLSSAISTALSGLFYSSLLLTVPGIGGTAAFIISGILAAACTNIAMRAFTALETKLFNSIFKNDAMKDVLKQSADEKILQDVPKDILQTGLKSVSSMFLPPIVSTIVASIGKKIFDAAAKGEEAKFSLTTLIITAVQGFIGKNAPDKSEANILDALSIDNIKSATFQTSLGKGLPEAVSLFFGQDKEEATTPELEAGTLQQETTTTDTERDAAQRETPTEGAGLPDVEPPKTDIDVDITELNVEAMTEFTKKVEADLKEIAQQGQRTGGIGRG